MNWSKIPNHLRPFKHWPTATRRRVEALADDYGISDSAGLVLLQSFGNADANETLYGERIAAEGATVTDRYGQVKPHPLVAAERDARAQKNQALKQLNVDLEPLKNIGRPAGGRGL